MKKYDIVLLTNAQYEHPKNIDEYVQNILDDDQLVQTALENEGYKVIRKDWASKDFDWSSCHYAIFRTTWDYFDEYTSFSKWLKLVEQKTTLINPSKTIFWNVDKHYLKDLKNKGVHVIPTAYIEKGDETSLENLHKKHGWKKTILKPVVSGAARHTYKLTPDKWNSHEELFQKLISEEAMMLQPFQNDVVDHGEVSYMLFGGEYTHAVLKKAKKGDFRVQDDFGGTVEIYHPSQEEIDFAITTVNACSPLPVYARVDVIRDNEGQLCIVELELIEPELWFRLHPNSAQVFARQVSNFIENENG